MSEEEAKQAKGIGKSLLRVILWSVGVFVVIFFVLLLISAGGIYIPQISFAISTGWVSHGIRVLPDFFSQWPSAILPLVALGMAWWVGHRLVRGWLATRYPAVGAWSAMRSGAVLAMVLLCGAAAIAISGLAHQLMWLGQAPWVKNSVRTKGIVNLSNTRLLMMLLVEFEADHGRLPHGWEELLALQDGTMQGYSNYYLLPDEGMQALPSLTLPGAELKTMNPATVVVVSDLVDGRHAVGMADCSARSISPSQLDAIIARGDWLFTDAR